MAQEKVLRVVFGVAALCNICWVLLVVLFPNLLFRLWGVPPINYPFIMSGLGMCIGLFGYGYWVVSRDLRSYPQLVIIGFLGKTLGPIGWVWTVFTTELPLLSMWTNVFNDLIFLPFIVTYFVWYRSQRSAPSATLLPCLLPLAPA